MAFATSAVIVGALLVGVALTGSLLSRIPLSTAMLYLAAGFVLGPPSTRPVPGGAISGEGPAGAEPASAALDVFVSRPTP